MAKQTFTTGQVLTAAQMSSLQQTAMGGGSPVVKTASYVLVAADAGTVIQMNSASSTTITVNTALFAAGDSVQIQNIGAGICTITAGTATVTTSGSLALGQWEGGYLYFTSASASIFFDYTQTGAVSPLTTKGDVWGYSTLDARIPVGANDTVLTADSTQALGLKWATPASGSMTLLATTTLSGTSTVVSSIAQTYNSLMLVGTGITFSASASFRIHPNSVTGQFGTTGSESGTAGSQTNLMPYGAASNASNSSNGFVAIINNYTSTNYKPAQWYGNHPANSVFMGGTSNHTSAITSLQYTTGAGTATLGGTIYLYGVK
jgi:hypothetical protein